MYRKALVSFLLLFTFFISRSQQLFESKINVSSGKEADNREAIIYLPANYSKSKAYPLVIFTHGMGEAGKSVKKLYNQGLPRVLKKGYRPPFDFIMVAVQRNSFSVMPQWLPGILKDAQKRWKIDESRIYLTGLSAGGWAVYGSQLNFTPAFAKKFAAIVINSGVTQNTNHKNFDWWKETKTPLWAIVGAADKSYVGKNAYMVNQINKRVPNLAKLTVRPGVGHGGWSDIYNGKVKLNGKNMWEWMYQFKRSSSGAPSGNDETTGKDDNNNSDGDNNSAPSVARSVKVNIYRGENPYYRGNWNNWNVGALDGSNINRENFKYSDGSSSSVSATLSESYRVVDNLEDYGAGMAPDGVLRYTSYSKQPRTLTISGLSHSKKYDITIFGSRRRRPGNTTLYKINQATRTIATNNNLTDKAFFRNLAPDAKGQIVVTIENLNYYNYLNGFMITESNTASGN